MATEVTLGENTYSIGKLSAMQQWHVTRRLAGAIAAAIGDDKDALADLMNRPKAKSDDAPAPAAEADPAAAPAETVEKELSPEAAQVKGRLFSMVMRGVSAMSDADSEFVIITSLSAVKRRRSGGQGWDKVADGSDIMFDDLDMTDMIALTFYVMWGSLAGFFSGSKSLLG